MNQLRPLSFGEVFDVSFKLYFRHFARFAGLVAMFIIPAEIIRAVITDQTVDFASDGNLYYFHSHRSAYTTGQIVAYIIVVVALLLVTATAFRAVSEAYLGGHPGVGESVRFALPRLLSVLWVDILAGIGIVVGLILFIVPGLILITIWSVCVPVLLLEAVKGRHALGRSRELVRGRFWQTFGILVVMTIIVLVIPLVIVAPIAAAILHHSSSIGAIVTTVAVLDAVLRILTYPLAVAVITVLYFDLRVRREGFDVAQMIDALGFDQDEGGVTVVGQPTSAPPPPAPAPQDAAPAASPSGWEPPTAPDIGLPEDPEPGAG